MAKKTYQENCGDLSRQSIRNQACIHPETQTHACMHACTHACARTHTHTYTHKFCPVRKCTPATTLFLSVYIFQNKLDEIKISSLSSGYTSQSIPTEFGIVAGNGWVVHDETN